nr:hypothetical protein [Tanacetum cinerariifolium]
MVAILEKGEFNSDFHPMVDFIAASPLRIVPLFDTMLVHQGEASGTPTEPHHTPFLEADTSHPNTSSIPLPSLPTDPISPVSQTDTTPIRDVYKGEACLTESGFIADQDRATIAKSSTLPHDSAPKVTSPAADEGSMQQTITELTALCTNLQRQHSELLVKFQAQEKEIVRLKERVQVLEDRESVAAKQFGDDAPIKRRIINEEEAAAERISNNSEEIARVLTSMDAAIVLAGGIDVPTSSGSIPTTGLPATVISTGSEVVPLLIDAQVARELEEQQEKEDMRMNEQIARDAKVAMIHAEEELQGMIKSLDKSNETIAKYLQEYQDFALELPLEKRIELISDLAQRKKLKGLNLEQEHVKKQKSSEEAPEIEKSTEKITEEKMKEMMQLVPVEDVYVQALQVKHPIIDWKVHTEGQRSYWKIIRVEVIRSKWSASFDYQRQRDLHASRKRLSSQKRFSTCDDQLQASVTVKCNIMYKDSLYYKRSPLALLEGLPEFADDTVTNYNRPSLAIESTSDDAQNRNPSVIETEASPITILPKPFIKFVKATDRSTKTKTAKVKTAKPAVKYAAMYSKPSKSSNVRGNQRNWNNLKSHQLGVKKERTSPTNSHKTISPRTGSSQNNIDDKGYCDSGCSRHMTGNISYFSDYEPFDGGYVSFGQGRCKITGKGTIKTDKLEFENVYFVKDLKFTWTFFLKTKDETSGILRKFITKIENQKDLKVKIIRYDNGGEFRNKEMNDFCSQKGIKREFCNARTPQQNGVAERRNRTLIKVARTKVLVNKSQNKTPYELFNGRTPAIGFLKPLGCHVMILNTLNNLGKFKAKGDEGTKDATRQEVKKDVSSLRYIALPNWVHGAFLDSTPGNAQDTYKADAPESSGNLNPTASSTTPPADQMETLTVETPIPIVSSPVPTTCLNDSQEPSSDTRLISKRVASQVETPSLDNILTLRNRFEDILRVTTNSVDSDGVEADVSNMETTITASPTPIVRIHKDHLKIYQIDVKSAFFFGTIDEEFYVMQPPGFQDPEFLTRVYKVEKAMYGLHQAPRAWYGTLSKYLLTNGFPREFEALIHEKFKMSAMVELNFFLGLQVLQKEDGIFLSQDKHQVTTKECHMHAVKRIFRYLKGHPKLGLWYPKESPFDLVAYSDSDYGGASQDRKSTTGGCQFLGRRLILWQCKKQVQHAMRGSISWNSIIYTTFVSHIVLGWVIGTSKYWGVLIILMISLRLIPLNLMHASVEWKLYDTCGVHHETSKDKEIFVLVEKDCPLKKGLAIVMICYKLQVENYSQMENDLILKIYKIANCPIMEFPLSEEVPTASKESSHCQKKRDATAEKIALLLKSSNNCQSKSYDSYA